MYYLAIDPGKSGAFVIKNSEGELIEMKGLPLIGKQYDWQSLRDVLTKYKYAHVGIENPGIIYGTSKSSVASLQRCVGTIEGMLIALKQPHSLISPKSWQKEMWKDTEKIYKLSKSGKSKVVDTKATSIKTATRLFPKINFKITNKGNESINYNEDMIDAALICEYIRKKY